MIKYKSIQVLFIVFILILISDHFLFSQDPLRFQAEIDSLKKLNIETGTDKKIILFTGSSSIKRWEDIQEYFPEYTIINTGFGGSHMSDLLFYLNEIVLQYRPHQVFIYEGDNDVAHGTRPGKILGNTEKVIERIHHSLPGITIVLLSPKPSPARWDLKKEYDKVNIRLRKLASNQDQILFIDVWSLMLDSDGQPIEELYVEDGIHMTKEGYDLWAGEISKYLQ